MNNSFVFLFKQFCFFSSFCSFYCHSHMKSLKICSNNLKTTRHSNTQYWKWPKMVFILPIYCNHFYWFTIWVMTSFSIYVSFFWHFIVSFVRSLACKASSNQLGFRLILHVSMKMLSYTSNVHLKYITSIVTISALFFEQ